MKKLFLSLIAISAGSVMAMAQTWLEKEKNGLSFGSSNPPSTGTANIYSEPFDTSWRQGVTGIGTAQWPKTRLQVHSNANADADLDLLMTGFGWNYTDFSSIFTSGGTNQAGSIASSLLGLTARHDLDDALNYGVVGIAYGNNMQSNHGIIGAGFGEGCEEVYGVSASANGNGNRVLVGLRGQAEGDGQTEGNFGVLGQCNSTDPNGVNVGVLGRGIHSPNDEVGLVNIGVHGRVYCTPTGGGTQFNCGVYGQITDCTDSTYGGAPYPTGSYAGFFDGNIVVTGTINGVSDRRLKENINPVSGITDRLSRVNIYSYRFRKDMGITLPNGQEYGVVAQELENIFPELVDDINVINHNDSESYRNIETYKSVRYVSFIPLLIQAVKELNEKTEAMDPEKSAALLANLKKQIEELQQNINSTTVANNIPQNDFLFAYPNPSNDDMIIDVRQVNCQDCLILITDLTGKLIKQYNVRGQEQKINVSSAEIGRGIFQCNLVSEGKLVSSIKIVFTQ